MYLGGKYFAKLDKEEVRVYQLRNEPVQKDQRFSLRPAISECCEISKYICRSDSDVRTPMLIYIAAIKHVRSAWCGAQRPSPQYKLFIHDYRMNMN